MTKTYLAGMIGIALLAVSVPADAAESAAERLKTAQSELALKNDDTAGNAFLRVLDALDATTTIKAAAYIGMAEIHARTTRPTRMAESIEEYEKALALPDLSIVERNRLLTLLAQACQRLPTPDVEKAVAAYTKIIDDPEIGNGHKITALNSVAELQLAAREGDVHAHAQQAHATLQRALTLPGLTPRDHLTALRYLGALRVKQADYPAARKAYEQMLELDTSEPNRDAVHQLLTATWVAEGNFDAAIAINPGDSRILDRADLYQRKGDVEAAQQELRTYLSEAGRNDTVSAGAFSKLLATSIQTARFVSDNHRTDYQTARKDAETFLPKLMEPDVNRASLLLPLLKDAMQKKSYEVVSWAAPIVMTAQNLRDSDYLACRVYQVNSLAGLGAFEAAAKAADTVATDSKLSAAQRYRFKVTATALRATGQTGVLKQALERIPADGLTGQEKVDAILYAARSAMLGGKHAVAHELYQAQQAMFAQDPPVSYVCEFMPSAPADVGAWLASPLRSDLATRANLNRKYGSNLAFLLETDASTTGRGASSEANTGSAADIATDMYATCDPDGIHFFFMAKDSKVDEVRSALLHGGSYEGYLAPGPAKPYYTYLIGLPSGTLSDSFNTMYSNRQFRQARKDDNTVRSSTQPTQDGFATYLFYDWALFYDHLPANGEAWQFDNIRWTRSGGYSWAGSQSVHNRSSWGDIVFSGLTPNNLRAIKRRLVYKAHARYKLERNANERGAIDFWQDEELGDPEFYNAALAPLVAKLDTYGKKVARDMSDADVDLLFVEAVPEWMEFSYVAAELRKAYLDERMFADDGGANKP